MTILLLLQQQTLQHVPGGSLCNVQHWHNVMALGTVMRGWFSPIQDPFFLPCPFTCTHTHAHIYAHTVTQVHTDTHTDFAQ